MPVNTTASGDTVRDENRIAESDLERVKEALRLGGGMASVSARSGIPTRSLSNYVMGRNAMKMPTLVALADACGVSIEWLASGRGPTKPSESPARPTSPPPAQPVAGAFVATPGMFGTVHIDKLAGCLEAARDALVNRGIQEPEMRKIVQVALVLYDALDAQETEENSHSERPSEDKKS